MKFGKKKKMEIIDDQNEAAIDDRSAKKGLKKFSRKQLIVYGILAAICLGVIVPFIFNLIWSGDTGEEEQTLVVETEAPEIRDVKNFAKIVGTVTGENSRSIVTQIEGEIISLPVKDGQAVKAGDIICVISSDQLTASSLAVQSAQAALSSTRVQADNSRIGVEDAREALETAEKELSRYQELYNAGAASLTELEERQNSVSNARRNLQNAENSYSSMQYSVTEAQAAYDTQVNSNQILMNNLYIKAPAPGVIQNLNIHLHDRVQPYQDICTVSSQSDMKLECEVSSSIAESAIVGSAVTITHRGNEYTGIVESSGKEASLTTGTCKLKIAFDNNVAPLAGSKATAMICTDVSSGNLTLSSSCIYFEGADAYVYVIEDGIAVQKFITIGIYDDTYTVITDGLSRADRVITTWSSYLFDGAEVEEAA